MTTKSDDAFNPANFKPLDPTKPNPVFNPFAGHTDSQGFFVPAGLPRVLRKKEWHVLESDPPSWLDEDFLHNQPGEE